MQTTETQIAETIGSVSETAATGRVLSANERLVHCRLGVLTGLFYALRAKHPPTAAHALRVAIGCSKWAESLELPERDRDILEVVALLHDIGKIGVPDRVLQKPSKLDEQESLVMNMQIEVAEELLRSAGAGDELLEVLRASHILHSKEPLEAPPIAARMLAVVDAFDSMTNDQLFRRALSPERAIEELLENAQSEIETELIRNFAQLVSQPRPELEAAVATRWLVGLADQLTPGFHETEAPASSGAVQKLVDTLFHQQLLHLLPDAAVYLDAEGVVLHWNRVAEQLTGHGAATVVHRRWDAQTLGLMTEDGAELAAEACPFQQLLREHTEHKGRFRLTQCDGGELAVTIRALPVLSDENLFSGAILLIRDASEEVKLEERVQTLHEIATQDPLTKVCNRAELNRRMPEFLAEHTEQGLPGSVIICDIDFFKRINDNYGHQAGDEALVTFAELLRNAAREDDLVVRYGGEEFVILCSNCDGTSATARAEQIRRTVEKTPVPALQDRPMTSSFGVSELRQGDNAESLIDRADRALLEAKESGRNRVVSKNGANGAEGDVDLQHLIAKGSQDEKNPTSIWSAWFRGADSPLLTIDYLASVPKDIAVEKLKGFINDLQGQLSTVESSRVVLRIDTNKNKAARSKGFRPAVLLMDIQLQNVQILSTGRQKVYNHRTKFSVSVSPVRARERRSEALYEQAALLLNSFQAYMVAEEIDEEMRRSIIEPR